MAVNTTHTSPKALTRTFHIMAIEKVAALYCAATCVLMVVLLPRLVDAEGMLAMRLEWLAMTCALIGLHALSRRGLGLQGGGTQRLAPRVERGFAFLRVLAQMGWLAKWYSDTYEFNRSFANLDHLFAAAEQSLFGCQPALEFCRALPEAIWSEAFNLGYWSYFPMIATLAVVLFWQERHSRSGQFFTCTSRQSAFNKVTATLLAVFFLYYVIYIFLPVAGPQFYFEAVGIDTIARGVFPDMGNHFRTHTDIMTAPGYADGLFYQLVNAAQQAGERPTAAFPSSHIGVSTILLLQARRHCKPLLFLFLPLWALLCCATVYIRAHYLIDAIAGLLSAPLMLWIAERMLRPLFISKQ